MIFDFYPWRLEIDVESTKQLYKEVDYSINKIANDEFIKNLTTEQKNFFNSLGVDITKIEIDKKNYDIPEDEKLPAKKIYMMTINFLMRGTILGLPKYQKDLYSAEDVFGKNFPTSVLTTDEEDHLQTYNNGIGLGIVFKHPCFYYDDTKFKTWNCGYILGTILITNEF